MSDAYARPTSIFTPFSVDAEYVWLDCEKPGYEGFRVEVRMNLTNRERKRLKIALAEIDEIRKAIKADGEAKQETIVAAINAAIEADDEVARTNASASLFELWESVQAQHEENQSRIHALMAPYVRDWNVQDRDETGAYIPAPAPMAIGVDAFDAVDAEMVGWIASQIIEAYKGVKGLSGLLRMLGESPAPITESSETTSNDAPNDNPSDPSPPSSLNLSSPSPSTSTD